MGVTARGGAPPAGAVPLLDVAALYGVNAGAGDVLLVRAGQWPGTTTTLFGSLTGAPAIKLMPPGVAYEFISAVNSVKAIGSNMVAMPFHAKPSAVLPSAGDNLRYYRYLLEATLWRVGALAGWPFSVYFNTSGYIGTGGPTGAGVQVSSRSDINGGNWTPAHRRTIGGAIVQGLDSGIPGTDPVRVAFDFSSGPTPALTVKLNGTVILTLTDSAELPTLTMPALGTNQFQFAISQGLSAGGGVGITDYATDVRWRIFSLS